MKNKLKFALVYGSTRKKRLGIRFVKYLANQILKNKHFPMIIDHPVLPIEEESRGGMVKFLKEISHQSICFHINIEKPGFIFEVGSENFRKEIDKANLITTARKALIKKSDLPEDALQTFNGIVSYDKEFYKDFRIKKDKENV